MLSLPYLEYVKDEKAPDKIGTTIYNKEKAYPGYNIFVSRSKHSADLIDMDGSLIHRWEAPDIRRDRKNQKTIHPKWQQITPLPNGSLLLTFCESNVQDWMRLDASSHILGSYDIPGQQAHHATYCFKDGGFLGLVSNKINIPFQDLTLTVLDNSLVHISPDWKTLKTIPLSKLFSGNPSYQNSLGKAYTALKKNTRRQIKDIFHSNNIENLEWDIPGIAQKGAWLVTIRNLDRIIIVDPKEEKIVWQWGENIICKPHHATFLKGDHVLLLDNGINKGSSRAVEVDIRSQEIVWQYGQKPGQEFFSFARGSAQRLPNGNTLIADADHGHAFEVTSSGEIVWEWYAEFLSNEAHEGARMSIYRMERLPYDFFKDVTFNHGKMKP